MKKLQAAFYSLRTIYKILFIILLVFTALHVYLWLFYYASYYGWVKKISILKPDFLLTGILYWLVYSGMLILFYSYGKVFFSLLVSCFIFSFMFTIPLSIAKVDLSIKFALLLQSNFEWIYVKNYINWFILSISLALILMLISLYYIYKYYRQGLKVTKKIQILIWTFFLSLMAWHSIIGDALDEESLPVIYYDNEIGRVMRLFIGLATKNFDIFNYNNLEGEFSLPENTIQGVYAILDTLEYEFLSIHKNKYARLNHSLKRFIDIGKIIDFGIVYSCGSHTTASLPNMMSMNGCKVGPKFRSEPILHLTNRIGIENHYIGAKGLSQYFSTIFNLDVHEENRHYIKYAQTSEALNITAQKIKTYKDEKSTFTMVYYDAVHPGIRCEFLTSAGLEPSICEGARYFTTANYKIGMPKAVEIIEQDIVNFIEEVEENPKPIFLLLTADHGLSPSFLHGDMADSDVSLDNIDEATQRHTNLLFYGNKAYRSLKKRDWETAQKNIKQYQNRLNHEVLFPTLLDAMGIKWSKAKKNISKLSVFSTELEPYFQKPLNINPYLEEK